MAIWVLCSWQDGASRVEVEIDANNRVTFLRRLGAGVAAVTISLPDGSRARTLPRGAGDAVVAVPTGVAGRLQLTFDAVRQRWDGLAGQVLSEG